MTDKFKPGYNPPPEGRRPAPPPPPPPVPTAAPRKFIMDWGTRMVTTEDGEIVNLYAEKDRLAQEMHKCEHNLEVATGEYSGVIAKQWLDYRAEAEHGGKKIQSATLDKMIDRDRITVGHKIHEAWLAKLEADADFKHASELFWTMKALTDIDIRRMT